MNHQDLLDQATQRIALAPKPIQAIEAFWAGDPSGWFLVMVALMRHLTIACQACGKAILPPTSPYRLADLCYPCELKAQFEA